MSEQQYKEVSNKLTKKNVKDDLLCASGLTDPTERKVMATAMKQGEDQIKILRESKEETQTEKENSDE